MIHSYLNTHAIFADAKIIPLDEVTKLFFSYPKIFSLAQRFFSCPEIFFLSTRFFFLAVKKVFWLQEKKS